MVSIIHETVLKDIVDIIDDLSDLSNDADLAIGNNTNSFKSITKNANDLILVFPALCTKGISIETASMITKAIEKNCVTLLQMLFASIQITDAENLKEYISKFHSNISIGDKITVDDFISFVDSVSESADAGIITITDRELYNKFKSELCNINNIARTSLCESSLSDFKCYKESTGINAVLESDRRKAERERRKTNKAVDDLVDALIPGTGNSRPRTVSSRANTNTIKDAKPSQVKAKEDDRYMYDRKFVEYLTNNDIKKSNELMPTKVFVSFKTKTNQKVENAVIGVKCKLYAVDSVEIIERISSKYADANWIRELVRASTGEISFWRDFVFALDRAKIDAINSSKRGSSAKMFKVLERRATKNRLSKWKANVANCAPITTLIINQDEAEYLKKDYNVDMENRNIALKLMESYNLMGFVIVDEPAESASFIWDEGNNASFETLSFKSLERESGDSNYKKVINLMTKISR